MVYQKGNQIGTNYGSYVVGDRLRVAVEGGVVKYRRNGTLLYTSSQADRLPAPGRHGLLRPPAQR